MGKNKDKDTNQTGQGSPNPWIYDVSKAYPNQWQPDQPQQPDYMPYQQGPTGSPLLPSPPKQSRRRRLILWISLLVLLIVVSIAVIILIIK